MGMRLHLWPKRFCRALPIIAVMLLTACGQSVLAETTGTSSIGTTTATPTTVPSQHCQPPEMLHPPPTFDFPLPPGTVIEGVVGASHTEANLLCTLGQTQAQLVAFMTAHLPGAGYHLAYTSPIDQYVPQCTDVMWIKNDASRTVAWSFNNTLPVWTVYTCLGTPHH
jgi:hypothetical protein